MASVPEGVTHKHDVVNNSAVLRRSQISLFPALKADATAAKAAALSQNANEDVQQQAAHPEQR